jgi:hypothetical protein
VVGSDFSDPAVLHHDDVVHLGQVSDTVSDLENRRTFNDPFQHPHKGLRHRSRSKASCLQIV